MSTLVYPYPPLLSGVLVKRYKRFFADICLSDGTIVTAHCPNTGPMTAVCEVGAEVRISQATSAKRRLAYTWELIYLDQTWIGINTHLPNRVVGQALAQHIFIELLPYEHVQAEVRYGTENSRIDFLLTGIAPTYVEVKNTTWTQPMAKGKLALFPDTVTTRGHKHLRELTRLAEQGVATALIYFVNRGDCLAFAPGEQADPEYGRLLRLAAAAGMLILPYSFEVSPEGLVFKGRLPLIL